MKYMHGDLCKYLYSDSIYILLVEQQKYVQCLSYLRAFGSSKPGRVGTSYPYTYVYLDYGNFKSTNQIG